MFCDNLKALRKQHELTQNELAEKLYVSIQSISRWETGESEPSFDVLLKIAEFFDVSTDYLLGKEFIPEEELYWQVYSYIINKSNGKADETIKSFTALCHEVTHGMFGDTFKQSKQEFKNRKRHKSYSEFFTPNGIALSSNKEETPKIFALLDFSEKNLNKYLYPDKKFTDYFSMLADERIFNTILKVHTLPFNIGYDKQALLDRIELSEADFDNIFDKLTKLVMRTQIVKINGKDTTLYFPIYNHYTIMVIAIVRLIRFASSNSQVQWGCEPVL